MPETPELPYEGGAFLLTESEPAACFTPEHFSDEEKEMMQAAGAFYEHKIRPQLPGMEKGDVSQNIPLLDGMAEHGLLGPAIPEAYGGLGLATNASLFMTETLGSSTTFATTHAVHTGIGTLPILYYGSKAQKEKYLPKIASGEYKPCYCLTEPEAGSDAAAGRTKATPKGTHYLLNGQKIWISNAGFADIFIVFAKVEDDKHLSAFIVEKSYGGIAIKEEKNKLGLKGSSTCQIFFTDCPVPKENLLGPREGGFKIAVNILNAGRLKLAGAVIGAAKNAIAYAVSYAKTRKQFNRTLVEFGAIQQKIAQMTYRLYACESAMYRTGALVDAAVLRRKRMGLSASEATLQGAEAYAVESAILKVYSSEVVGYIIDEALQIQGGMGYSEEGPIAGMYRDVRIARIYEGTNEINRMLVVGMLLRYAENGRLPLAQRAEAVGDALLKLPPPPTGCAGPLQTERQCCEKLKELFLLIVGRAAQVFGKSIDEKQEVLMYAADIVMAVYVVESAFLRAARLQQEDNPSAKFAIMAAQCCLHEEIPRIQSYAADIISALPIGKEEQKVLVLGTKRLSKAPSINSIALKRALAAVVIDKDKYPFSYVR